MTEAVFGRMREATLSCTDPRNDQKEITWSAILQIPDSAPEVMIVENAFPFLGELVEAAEQHGFWEPCTVTSDGINTHYDERRNNSRCCISSAEAQRVPELGPFSAMLHAVEAQFICAYEELGQWTRWLPEGSHLASRSSGYDLLRYRKGQHFETHTDRVRGDTVLGLRVLSAVAFCNEDFEGGELEFPRHDLRIRPRAGMLVLFPSDFTFPHRACDVIAGTKYSCVTWFF